MTLEELATLHMNYIGRGSVDGRTYYTNYMQDIMFRVDDKEIRVIMGQARLSNLTYKNDNRLKIDAEKVVRAKLMLEQDIEEV